MRSFLYLTLLLPCAAFAGTIVPSAENWGWDDDNIVNLNPLMGGTAPYVTFCPFVSSALANSSSKDNVGWAFSDSNSWTFRWASAAASPAQTGNFTINGAATVQPFMYSAWVVHNDGYNLPDGSFKRPRSIGGTDVNGDVGGANFTLTYQPGDGNPSLDQMHFFQVVKTVTTFGDPATEQPNDTVTRYFIDNAGDPTTPFYDLSGGWNGNVKNGSGQVIAKYLQDTPYRCEPDGSEPNCRTDNAKPLLSIDWQAQTFVAVDLGSAAKHDVVLYGGRWWGWTYTNADVPEPALNVVTGLALIGLAVLQRRRHAPRHKL